MNSVSDVEAGHVPRIKREWPQCLSPRPNTFVLHYVLKTNHSQSMLFRNVFLIDFSPSRLELSHVLLRILDKSRLFLLLISYGIATESALAS